jgi:hypothetical protein
MQEIELLQKLQHRNIVAFLGKEIMDKVPFSPFGSRCDLILTQSHH